MSLLRPSKPSNKRTGWEPPKPPPPPIGHVHFSSTTEYRQTRHFVLRDFREALASAVSCACALELDPVLDISEEEYAVLCRIQLKINLALIGEMHRLREMKVQA